MQAIRIVLLLLIVDLALSNQAKANSDTPIWLPAVVYHLQDDSATVPVTPSNTRQKWDEYSLDIQLDVSGQLQMQWQPLANATHYLIEYRTADGEWQQQTAIGNSFNLPEGIEGAFEFRVIGCQSQSVCSDYSNSLSTVVTDSQNQVGLPSIFYVPAYIAQSEPFAVVWSEVESAQAYELQMENLENGEFSALYSGLPTFSNGRFELRNHALSNGQYCFRLRVKTTDEFGSYSDPVCSIVGEQELPAPGSLVAEASGDGQYTFTWQSVPGAASYRLERESLLLLPAPSAKSATKIDSLASKSSNVIQSFSSVSSTAWETISSSSARSSVQTHTIDTYDRNGLQKYRVSACDSEGTCGENSGLSYTIAKSEIVDAVPQNVVPNIQSANDINVDWSPVPGASYYEVEMTREGSTFIRQFPNLEQTSVSIEVGAGKYLFKVKACIDTGFCADFSPVAEYVFDVESITDKTPQFFYVTENTPANGIVEISWKAPAQSGVTKYEVVGELSNTLENRTFIADSNGYFKLQRNAKAAGRHYCYKVKAWYSNESGDFTQTKCTLVGELAFNAPGSIGIDQTDTQNFTVSWSEVADASSYLLERQLSASEWQPVTYLNSTSHSILITQSMFEDYTQLGHLSYRVSACNQQGFCGDYRRVVYSTLTVDSIVSEVPDNQKIPACLIVPERVNSGESIRVSWCPAEADNVVLYELQGELKSTIVSSAPGSLTKDEQGLYSTMRPALPAGREYCYAVKTVFSDGSESDYTAKSCVIVDSVVFDAPSNMLSEKVVGSENLYTIGWTAVSGSDHYVLEKLSSVSEWEAVSCAAESIQINGADYRGCSLTLFREDMVAEVGQVGFRVSACDSNGVCGNYRRHYFLINPEPKIIQFEWIPAEVSVNEPTSFFWAIENVSSCTATTAGDGTSTEREASGTVEAQVYFLPGEHLTQWYCTDLDGHRFPRDINQFLSAPRTVNKLPAPVDLKVEENRITNN